MSVCISLRGTLQDSAAQGAFLDWVAEEAAARDWMIQEVSWSGPLARMGQQVLERPEVLGLIVVPHVGCEPIPLAFHLATGTLVDADIRITTDGAAELSPEPIFSTQFAGPECHLEVLEFLVDCAQHLDRLDIDDETGWIEHRQRAPVEACFAESRAAITKALRPHLADGEYELDVGPFVIRKTPSDPLTGSEFGAVEEDQAGLLISLGEAIDTFTMLQLAELPLDDAVFVMDECLSEFDPEDWRDIEEPDAAGEQDDEVEPAFILIHGLGAAYGRALIREFGGHWETPEEEPPIAVLGDVGLYLSPFFMAMRALESGPACSLENCTSMVRDVMDLIA